MTMPRLPAGRRVALCFHGIGTRRRVLEEEEDAYWVSRDQFLAILDEVADWPTVDISFDDGNVSDVEIALPALQERGLSGTFYALMGRLDQPGSLSPEDLRALTEAGMEVGTHGWGHVPWTGLDAASLRREIAEARLCLTEAIRKPVTKAALPFGRYDRHVLRALREEAYERVSTSDRALSRPDDWLSARFSVHATDNPESIRALVTSATHARVRAVTSAKGAVKRRR
jgi:peptidoglycan/xylan/chitin deacetylase (PgdA/CDA1 family)